MEHYRLRSKIQYVAVSTFIVAVMVAILFMPFFNPGLTIYVTVLAAGASLALQKYLASFAGFFLIKSSNIFDEIRIPITPKSDARKAAGILSDLLKDVNLEFVKDASAAFGDGLPNFMQDVEGGPKVTIHIDEKNIWIKGRFVTPISMRNDLKTRISMGFLDRVRGDPTIEIGEK